MPVPGFPGYFATPAGRVYSARTQRVLVGQPVGAGYLKVTLRAADGGLRQVYVHRAVALAYHGEPQPGEEVAHENGNKEDNRPRNLSWKSRSANHHDKHRHGTMPRPNARLTPAAVQDIRRRYTPRRGVGALAAEYGVGIEQIRRIAKGEQWQNLFVI